MSIFSEQLVVKAKRVATLCATNKLMLATAESCTGGLLSALFTELPGASKFFTHGFVTYANEAKIAMLRIDAKMIADRGAVSEPVACAMAENALKLAQAALAVAITGIAGPDGGTPHKPVGLVHIAVAYIGGTTAHQKCNFTGDREAIRLQAVEKALDMLLQ